jgi:hypothetical protein
VFDTSGYAIFNLWTFDVEKSMVAKIRRDDFNIFEKIIIQKTPKAK